MANLDIRFIRTFSAGKKRSFIFYGAINFFITHSTLQLLLLIIPIFLATVISHIINLLLGFYLYGKNVFNSKKLTFREFRRYIAFTSFSWIFNFSFIKLMHEYGISKNLAAIFTIPFLICISYFFQKKYIFK